MNKLYDVMIGEPPSGFTIYNYPFAYTKEGTLLSVKDLSFSYEPGKKIIKNVSFEICDIKRVGVLQGQVVSLIGRSGIGKTTLFKLLAGLLKPDSGSVVTPKGNINPGEMGIVPQNYLLFNHRKVKDNLMISAERNLVFATKKEREGAVAHYAGLLGIQTLLNHYPLELSGGQRQRVSIIQQIVNGSDFILLDEPFSGLDHKVKKDVMNTLLAVSLLDETKTLIVVSHDIKSSILISDTAIVLSSDKEDPGAYVKLNIDLAQRGISWDPNTERNPVFVDTLKEIEEAI